MTMPPPPPENVALLFDILGAEDGLRLIEMKGGTKFWIPSGVNNSSEKARADLEAEFSKSMAKELIRGFGGGYLAVPLCAEWRTALYAHRGMSHMEIAVKLGCHYETVGRRLRRGLSENRQSAWAF